MEATTIIWIIVAIVILLVVVLILMAVTSRGRREQRVRTRTNEADGLRKSAASAALLAGEQEAQASKHRSQEQEALRQADEIDLRTDTVGGRSVATVRPDDTLTP